MNDRHGVFARLREDDRGAALLTVLGISLVLLILIAIGASWSLSGLRKSATDNDSGAALAAAYAGADEYTSRLANDATYYKYGNPASTFSTATASTVVLPTAPVPANPAFNVTAATGWASVPGSSGRSSFRYEVDNSNFDRTGVIRIRSTGKVGTQVRSIIVNVKQEGFIDYLYYTDYEFADPLFSSASCTPLRYEYVGAGHVSACTEIQFMPGDVLNGPVHSNDTMRICGSTFTNKATVTTGDPRSTNWVRPSGCSTPSFGAGIPASASTIGMPPTNAEMKKETYAPGQPDSVARPGCMYTGPTKITFNAAGTMTIVSPWTKFTQPNMVTPSASLNPTQCGSVAALNSYTGATIPVLDRNLIYVQDVPSATGTDPNKPASATAPPTTVSPSSYTCATGAGGGWSYKQTAAANSPRIGFPFVGSTTATTETTPALSTATTPAYDCRRGDVFVEGTLKGAMTIAATNVYVTGDITYSSATDDILGLVGQNSVWVWNPMASGTSIYTAYKPAGSTARRIDAAILSVAHVFQAQNYSVGGYRGVLTVNGAIAQKFRGIVTEGGDGYDKAYNYDQRFKTIAPPKFLTPTSTTYGVTQYASTKAAYTPTGAPN